MGENLTSRVWLAEHVVKTLKIKQTVVLKVFTRDFHLQPRLQMESLLRARHCPHLVKVLKLEYFKKNPALILQAIKGLNLKQLLRKKPLTREESLYILQQSFQGLKELKHVGLAHGDLSLSNILIDYKACVYLSDYGLANYKHQGTYGTEPFIAPELSALEKSADFSSDLFSLGVLKNILLGGFKSTELNLLNHTHFIQARHPLLDPNPLKRKVPVFTQMEKAPLSLKQKISEILMAQNHSPGKVQARPLKQKNKASPLMPLSPPLKKTKMPGGKIWPGGILFLLILLLTNPLASHKKLKVARVLVHTQKWIYAELDVLRSYAPFQVRLPAGKYTLKWKTHNQEGTKHLHLIPGQTLLLSDHDFP